MKSSNDIGCSKDALAAINSEVNRSGVALTSGSHGLVKINHHSQVEKLEESHKRLERVALNEPHRIPKLRQIGKSWNVIKMFVVEVLVAAINVA